MTRIRTTRWLAMLVVTALAVTACGGRASSSSSSGKTQADPGITDTEISLGSSNALSGPASAYGVISRSLDAYFKYQNAEKGGVKMGDGKTRKIKFTFYDDAYTPQRMVENVQRLVEQDKVFALFNTLGTAPNGAILPYVNQNKVPQSFVATGSSLWGANPKANPWTIGWQPAYPTEGAIYGAYLKKEKPNAKVAVLYQNDDFGKDYLTGFEKAIEGSGVKIVARQSYQTTDPTVDSQVTNLSQSGADVFFNVTTPKFAAQAIKKVAETGWKPVNILANVSASIATVLKPAGVQNSTGIITAAYAKDPNSPQWANDEGMKSYKEKLKQYGPAIDVNDNSAVYAFGVGDTLVKTLQKTKAPTRQAFMDAARNLDTDNPLLLPGIKIKTSADDGFPIESEQLSKFDGTGYTLFGDVLSYEGKTPIPGR